MNITVIGLGHLGIVACSGLAMAGHRVVGVDVDRRRIGQLRRGVLPMYEPGLSQWVGAGVKRDLLYFSHADDFVAPLGDIVMVATGTPPFANGEADLRQIRSALSWVRSRNPSGQALVMKSTVPPGSGVEFIRQDLRGLDVTYVSNPEFLREGRALQDWMYPDRMVIGTDDRRCDAVGLVKRMYEHIEAPCLVTDIVSAEMLKYASNAYLATRISFINEIASLCERTGASIDAVSEGLAMDDRMGDKINAGIGYGGSCFPKDIQALSRLAYSAGIDLPLLTSVSAVNDHQRLLPLSSLRSRFGGTVAGRTVGVLGLSFKPGTSDIRHAASLDTIHPLVEEGARVRAYDPQATAVARRVLPADVDLVGTPGEAAQGAEALLLLTEWDEIVNADWASIADDMRCPKYVFDGRNALEPARMTKLGFEYNGVGRGALPALPTVVISGLDHSPAKLSR